LLKGILYIHRREDKKKMKTKNEYLIVYDDELELIATIKETTQEVANFLEVSKPTALKIINEHLSYKGYKVETQRKE
jgi:uncharacterized protein YhfF